MSQIKHTSRMLCENYSASIVAWVRSCLEVSKKLFAQIMILGLAAVAFAVGLMFVAGYLISASAAGVYSILMLNVPLAFVQIFGLGKPILRYFERLESHDWVLRLTSNLRKRLFAAAQAQQREDHRLKTGELLGSLAADIEHTQNLFLRAIFPVFIAWLAGLLLVIIAGCFSLELLAFGLGMLLMVCVIVPLLSLLASRATLTNIAQHEDALYTSLTDCILGAQDIAISGRGAAFTERFIQDFASVRAEEKRINRQNRLFALLVRIILALAFFGLITWATMRFGGVPSTSIGGASNWIIAVAFGFFPLIEVFSPLYMQFQEGYSHLDGVTRLQNRELLEESEELLAHPAPVPEGFSINVQDLTFTYSDAKPTFANLSLKVPQRQKVAILGKSGSGKTTLAQLIYGNQAPSAGAITLGGASVKDLRGCMHQYVGYVSQESYVFNMTILENLRLAKPSLTEEEAWKALEMVELKDHVKRIPQGLNTMATEAGLNFSGGQRQRLALARILLQDTPVIILDEPTTGLDPFTEAYLLQTILRVFENKTLLYITHHLQGVSHFDRVVFLEDDNPLINGNLAMDASPAELLASNERFQKLKAFDKGLFSKSGTI